MSTLMVRGTPLATEITKAVDAALVPYLAVQDTELRAIAAELAQVHMERAEQASITALIETDRSYAMTHTRSAPHAANPPGCPMTLVHDVPYAAAPAMGGDRAMAECSSWLHIRRAEGFAGALSSAGLVAVLRVIADYLASLSPLALSKIADFTPGPGGLEVHLARTSVSVPAAPGDADALAASLAEVLAAEGNVIVDPSC